MADYFLHIGEGSVTVPDNAAVRFGSGDFSICFVAKTAGELQVGKASGSFGWIASVNEDGLFFLAFAGPGNSISCQSSIAFDATRWNHFIVSVDRMNGKVTFFINAEAEVINIGSFAGAIDSAVTMALQTGGDGILDGMIDDLRVYKRVTSQAQATALYNSGRGSKYTSGDASAAWNMDEGDGTVIHDAVDGLEGSFDGEVEWVEGGTPFGDYYNIYRGQDGVIDYDNRVAQMELRDNEVAIADQDLPPGTIWHYVRKQVRIDCGLEGEASDPCVVRVDQDGNVDPAAPNTPQSLTAEAIAGGKIKLRWRYVEDGQDVPPDGFAVYQTEVKPFGDVPAGIVLGGRSLQNEFTWHSEELTDGVWLFRVVAYNNNGGMSQPAEVMGVVDGQGPAAIQTLIAEVE